MTTRKTPTKRRRRAAFTNPTPIAVKSTSNASKATIPVSIRTTTGDPRDAKAVIPVQVETRGGKSVRRAALVPITVKKKSRGSHAAKQGKSRHGLSRSPRTHQEKSRPEQRDLFTRGVVALTNAEETAVDFAGHLSTTVLEIVPKWLEIGMRIPFQLANKAGKRAEELYSETAETLEELAA